MLRKGKKLLLVALALLLLFGGGGTALAATQGSAENPLVTLSYLKSTFTEAILKQLDEKLSAAQSKYKKDLDEKIAAYSNELKQLSGGAGGASFEVKTLTAGQSLTISSGSELVAREGALRCADTEALIDSTSGQAFAGGSLAKNHLYVVTGSSCLITADGAATILLRGTGQ